MKRMDKQDKELKVVGVLSTALFIAMLMIVPRQTVAEPTESPIREVEHYVYQPPRLEHEQVMPEPFVVSETTKYYEPTEEEIDLMARVVMSEASILPLEGKQAVAQTIINRMYSSKFPNNIEAVITQPYQYSTADNGTPDRECYEAVDAACRFKAFPDDMYYFRAGKYHSFGYEYMNIGNTYFSTEGDINGND